MLDPEEWLIAMQLHDLLKVKCSLRYTLTLSRLNIPFMQIFKDTTTFFSRLKISNLMVIILAMDHLDKHLVTALTEMQYSLPIHSATCIGIKTLNKYYSKMDQSELYCIVMGKCFILLAATFSIMKHV